MENDLVRTPPVWNFPHFYFIFLFKGSLSLCSLPGNLPGGNNPLLSYMKDNINVKNRNGKIALNIVMTLCSGVFSNYLMQVTTQMRGMCLVSTFSCRWVKTSFSCRWVNISTWTPPPQNWLYLRHSS